MQPSCADADIRAVANLVPERHRCPNSFTAVPDYPSTAPNVPIRRHFLVLEGSSFVSDPLHATAFGSNLGSEFLIRVDEALIADLERELPRLA